MAKRQRKQKKGILRELFSLIVVAAVTFLISFGLQKYVISHVTVSGESMSPTLHTGDHLFMYRLSQPKRFDIVVITAPDGVVEDNGEKVKSYIKRIIGMPGDVLEYKNDTLYINGTAYEEPYLTKNRQALPSGYQLMYDETLVETLKRVKQTNPALAEENTKLVANSAGQMVIPEGYYYVLGDNRNRSNDGNDFGLTKKELVQGIAVVRIWPFDRLGIAPLQ